MNDAAILDCEGVAEGVALGAADPSTARVQFHIHINCFSDRLPVSVQRLQASKAVTVRQFTLKARAGDRPLWIATKKLRTAEDADHWHAETTRLLAADPAMQGYMEAEAVYAHNVVQYRPREYQPAGAFPIADWEPRRSERAADIHVFRSAKIPRDALDECFANAGFYEVADSVQRIWTLLIGNRLHAQEAFESIKEHFSQAGGIFKLELEFVRTLIPFPHNYALQPVYLRGGAA